MSDRNNFFGLPWQNSHELFEEHLVQQEIQRAAGRFLALRKTLYSTVAEAQRDALNLSEAVVDPASADAEAVWAVLWPKPLYAGKQVKVANVWHEQLRPNMAGIWQQMRYTDGPYAIDRQIVRCKSDRRNMSSFALLGSELRALKLAVNAPPQSYYAIVGAGSALAGRAKRSSQPFNDLPSELTLQTIKDLTNELGFGWGHVAVMHFLTDLGICCKPDIHLVRTMRALGLYGKRSKGQPSLMQALEVDSLVKGILRYTDGAVTPRGLRQLDKNLMDISLHGLI